LVLLVIERFLLTKLTVVCRSHSASNGACRFLHEFLSACLSDFFPRDDYDLVRQDSVLGSAILESRATVECTE
jgi:hypothetical protein